MGLQRRREFDPGGEVLSELSNGIDELGPESFSTPRIHRGFVTAYLQAVHFTQFMHLPYIAYCRIRFPTTNVPFFRSQPVQCQTRRMFWSVGFWYSVSSNIRVALSP